MNKPRLGIDIDEILRAKWLAFDRYYEDEFGEKGKVTEPFDTYDLRKHFEFKETEIVEQFVTDEFLENETLQKISPKEYLVNEETGRASVDDFAFNTEKTILSGDQMFEKFLYEDYCYQIHGSAPKLYQNADVDLQTFLKLFGDNFDVFLFAKTKKAAIMSSLFFLAKMRTEVKNFTFVESDEEAWEKFDWIMTTNPDMLEKKPEGKVTLKLTRLYNIESDADYSSDIGTVYGFTSSEADDMGLVPAKLFQGFLENKLNLKK
jgi:hypothetical protein